MLGDRVCVKVSDTEDAFGEPITKLSFYCDTARVVRFLNGRGGFISHMAEALSALRTIVGV